MLAPNNYFVVGFTNTVKDEIVKLGLQHCSVPPLLTLFACSGASAFSHIRHLEDCNFEIFKGPPVDHKKRTKNATDFFRPADQT